MQILLRSASFLECKASLGSFVRRAEFDRQQVRIEYTMPVTFANELTATSKALSVESVWLPE